MKLDNKGDEAKSDGDKLNSKYLTDAENVKQKLDALSPSFCLAKWQQVSLHLTTGMNNSCYHPPLHPIPKDLMEKDPSVLHNTPHKKLQRIAMLNGHRPKECDYCWAIEDAGNISDRQYRSGEPWALRDYDDIKNMQGDENVIPRYVEVNFSHLCNLACSYCSPQFSSTWMTQAEQQGAYPTEPPHNDAGYFVGNRKPIPIKESNPFVDAFWRWWPELYPRLEHFRMTGGEPLMDPNTYRVFDYVLANPKQNLHLDVTSNFSQEPRIFDRYLDYVKRLCTGDTIEHFMQYVSLDSWGVQAEYSRQGLDFNLLWNNVTNYLEAVPYKNSLTFIITMNSLALPGLKILLENILSLRRKYSQSYQRIWFDTPYLRQPSWQSLRALPPIYSEYITRCLSFMETYPETEQTRFHGFKDYEIQRLARVRDWMVQPNNTSARDHANFYRFFSEYDRRHSTDFVRVFPEYKDFWDQCKFYATNK